MQQEIRFCRASDDVTLGWARSGRGPALVKAANWLSHLEYDWNSPVWRPLLERLGAHSTVIRYDERGCGLSDRDVQALGFESWVRDLEAVVDAAGLDRFPLLGISQGGPIAIAYAARHPERVSRLILYGTYVRGRLHREPEARAEADALVRMVRVGWGRDQDAYHRLFADLFWPEATPEQMRAFTELQRISASPETAARIMEGFDEVDVREEAASLDLPTLVLHVKGDARIPFAEGRLAASTIPGAELVPLPGRNHVVAPEDPAFEPLIEEIQRFLRADASPDRRPLPDVAGLTPREREVLNLIARGWDNARIAESLFITPKTARNHVSNVFGKLGVSHRGEAVARGRELGFGLDERQPG